MSWMSLELYKQVSELRRQDERRQAASWRLARASGGRRQGWRFESACWLLRRLGQALIALGERLQRIYGPSQPATR